MILSGAAVVVVGALNPAIMNTGWFRRFRILDDEELAPAETGEGHLDPGLKEVPLIGSRQVAQIPCRSLLVQVDEERFTVTTKLRGSFDKVKQLTARVFSVLGHTPVTALGTNFDGEDVFLGSRAGGFPSDYFVGERDRINSVFPSGWHSHVRLMSKSEEPRIQFDLTDIPTRPGVARLHVNFHYGKVGAGSEVASLLDSSFERDLQHFSRIVEALVV